MHPSESLAHLLITAISVSANALAGVAVLPFLRLAKSLMLDARAMDDVDGMDKGNAHIIVHPVYIVHPRVVGLQSRSIVGIAQSPGLPQCIHGAHDIDGFVQGHVG